MLDDELRALEEDSAWIVGSFLQPTKLKIINMPTKHTVVKNTFFIMFASSLSVEPIDIIAVKISFRLYNFLKGNRVRLTVSLGRSKLTGTSQTHVVVANAAKGFRIVSLHREGRHLKERRQSLLLGFLNPGFLYERHPIHQDP